MEEEHQQSEDQADPIEVLIEPPAFADFLNILSSDQRRITLTVLLKAGLLKMADKILAEESPEAREYFQKLKKYEEEKGSTDVIETDTENKLVYSLSHEKTPIFQFF